MSLRDKTNDELFQPYNDDLALRIHNDRKIRDYKRILSLFRENLGDEKPSREAAKAFLSQYANHTPNTLVKYSQMLVSFMKWYGEPLDAVKIKRPHHLPPYVEDADVHKIMSAVRNKRSHKNCIERDLLMINLAWRIGMRRVN